MSPERAPLPTFDDEALLEGILSWVAVESPSYEPQAVNAMMDLAERFVRDLGASVERTPGVDGFGDIMVARMPFEAATGSAGPPGILILGHLDTVHPLGTAAKGNPIRREGDRVYGPGIQDMKGGFYMALHVLQKLQARGQKLALPVTIMFVPDEEVGSPTSRAAIEAEAQRHRYVLVPEPARGNALITGRHGVVRYHVHAHGRPAHAGRDIRDGLSAIRAMAQVVERLEQASDHDSGITYAVGRIHGGQWVNVVPTLCSAEVLCVAPTQAAFAEIDAFLASLTEPRDDGIAITVEPGPRRPLAVAHPGTRALFEVARSVGVAQGVTLTQGQFGGGSDGNFTGALEIATLDGLGVKGAGLHTLEEHIEVSALGARAALFAGLLLAL